MTAKIYQFPGNSQEQQGGDEGRSGVVYNGRINAERGILAVYPQITQVIEAQRARAAQQQKLSEAAIAAVQETPAVVSIAPAITQPNVVELTPQQAFELEAQRMVGEAYEKTA